MKRAGKKKKKETVIFDFSTAWKRVATRQELTYRRMMIFPKPYQRPPAPTKAESFTLLASALSAFRTRELNGGGMVKSA